MGCDDSTKVLLDPLVLSFGESIRLRVEGSGQVLFDSKFLSDGLPEVGSETRVSVADDLGRESKPSVYVVEV